ncbi:hypothetical protein BDR26DRAFT_849396 [Obelidium mucronatum]|nr:hypothetical protein BDR26DRAFT_849396 [Obelidium mucronatum]
MFPFLTLCAILAILSENVQAVSSATPPPFLYRFGGPVIKNIEVNPIFYGHHALEKKIFRFYGAVVQSSWWSILKQYGVETGSIGQSVFTPAKNQTLYDAQDIKPMLYNMVKAGVLTPDLQGNSYYPIHTAAGIKVISQQQGVDIHSCTEFSGYHESVDISDLGIPGVPYLYYGVVVDCSTPGEDPALTEAAISWTASHELAEVATDALANVGIAILNKEGLGSLWKVLQYIGWYDVNLANPAETTPFGEVGDLCEFETNSLVEIVGGDGHKYNVTKLWSNAANGCVSK